MPRPAASPAEDHAPPDQKAAPGRAVAVVPPPGPADDAWPSRGGAPAAKATAPMPRILAVWTRTLDGVESVGRVNVARAVRDTLARIGLLSNVQLRSVFESRSLAALPLVAWKLAGAALRGQPMPLQCAIFAAGTGGKEALRIATQSDIVYADGIRTLPWLRQLRRHRPEVDIVLDLDDLMSRRYGEVLERRLPLSLGYLERMMPRGLVRLAFIPALARLILGYERMALRCAEREALRIANRVILLNAHEASLLRSAAPKTASGRPGSAAAQVLAIPPPAVPKRMRPALRPPWRAVFVGTDALVQNRLSIDYLLELWARERIPLPLVLYGRYTRPPRPVPGVTWAGYAPDIATIYAPGSILVTPTFLPGGIKTKILEGFACGVPVVGNPASFEGLALSGYPLCFEHERDLLAFLADPDREQARMMQAVEMGSHLLEAEHSPELFRHRWAMAMGVPQAAGLAVARTAVLQGVPAHRPGRQPDDALPAAVAPPPALARRPGEQMPARWPDDRIAAAPPGASPTAALRAMGMAPPPAGASPRSGRTGAGQPD
ncbi:MAG: glycosyltransferase [Acetobacteraceae bacterium]|nr:glycosyltransferase [Acetobacteraceae bacterium]